jgi:hypothetical protein
MISLAIAARISIALNDPGTFKHGWSLSEVCTKDGVQPNQFAFCYEDHDTTPTWFMTVEEGSVVFASQEYMESESEPVGPVLRVGFEDATAEAIEFALAVI